MAVKSKPKRPYRLGRRAESARKTKAAILSAAARAIRTSGVRGLTIEAVARSAKVSRVTVYDHFEDKAALIEAVTWRAFASRGIDKVRQARLKDDVRAALVDFVAENARYQRSLGDAAQILRAAISDPDGAQAARAVYFDSRQASIGELVERLRGSGELASDVDVDHAVSALMIITSVETLDYLLSYRGLSIEDASSTLVSMASCLLRDQSSGNRK